MSSALNAQSIAHTEHPYRRRHEPRRPGIRRHRAIRAIERSCRLARAKDLHRRLMTEIRRHRDAAAAVAGTVMDAVVLGHVRQRIERVGDESSPRMRDLDLSKLRKD